MEKSTINPVAMYNLGFNGVV